MVYVTYHPLVTPCRFVNVKRLSNISPVYGRTLFFLTVRAQMRKVGSIAAREWNRQLLRLPLCVWPGPK